MGPDEYAWAQAFYADEPKRKAAFERLRDYMAGHAGCEVIMSSGTLGERRMVAAGVPVERSEVLVNAPWGRDACFEVVPFQLAQALYARHLRVALEHHDEFIDTPRGTKRFVANHDEAASHGESYLRPDGTLGEKL
jgi:hypothetical protein